MGKIDTSTIEGFENMSAEEKVNALLSFEIAEPKNNDAEILKLKNSLSKSNSEAADYKRKLQEKMTEDERKEALRKESEEAMKNELEALRKEKTVSTYKASFLGLGYAEELAQATAEAMSNGDMATVFANQKLFNEAQAKAFLEKSMSQQPGLSSGVPPKAQNLDELSDEEFYRQFGK